VGLLGGLWEFPGGMQEAGRSDTATIGAGVAEELGITVSRRRADHPASHIYQPQRLRFMSISALCSGDPARWPSQRCCLGVEAGAAADFPFPAANSRIMRGPGRAAGPKQRYFFKGSK